MKPGMVHPERLTVRWPCMRPTNFFSYSSRPRPDLVYAEHRSCHCRAHPGVEPSCGGAWRVNRVLGG